MFYFISWAVKNFRKIGGSLTKDHRTSKFPPARPNGPISTELGGIGEMHRCASNDDRESQGIPYYEKASVSLYLLSDILIAKKKTTLIVLTFDFRVESRL